MISLVCAHSEVKRFGKDRKGNQRFRCKTCGKTFSRSRTRPLGNLRIPMAKAEFVLRLMMEGTSIRAIESLTGVNQNTIMSLLVEVGTRCKAFLRDAINGIEVNDLQADEIWGFCGMKRRTAEKKNAGPEYFCRVHQTLKSTPAVAAGLTDSTWTISRLLEETATQF